MISNDMIMSKLQAYANSTSGKKKMKGCIDDVRKSGKGLASGDKIADINTMSIMANDLVEMIRQRLPASIAEVGGALVAHTPVRHPDGSYTVTLSFSGRSAHRDSLLNSLGYDGIDNIVALFNNGYHAKNYVYGWWDVKGVGVSRSLAADDDYTRIRSRKEREALQFMQDAEAEFNTKYGAEYNVIVQLGSDYTE